MQKNTLHDKWLMLSEIDHSQLFLRDAHLQSRSMDSLGDIY